jgi:muramoyltetrapeptide carboxypeptidase
VRKPERLRPGDLVGVAALSGACHAEKLEAGCAKLRSFGYHVLLAPNVSLKSGVLSLAGSDAQRRDGYLELIAHPEVKAILFTRGGYGVQRVLPMLDAAEIAARPKIHCGFSDLTALAGLLSHHDLPFFHGPMVAADLAYHRDPLSAAFFPSMLEGRGPKELWMPDADILVPGRAGGRLAGGCLSMLASMVGAPEEPDYTGAILLLEDVNEEAYRVDKMLATLQRAGRFAKLRGILVGGLRNVTFGGVVDEGRLRRLLLDRLGALGIPVAAGFPFGHILPNVTLPLGAQATWDGRRKVLRLEEEIVA